MVVLTCAIKHVTYQYVRTNSGRLEDFSVSPTSIVHTRSCRKEKTGVKRE